MRTKKTPRRFDGEFLILLTCELFFAAFANLVADGATGFARALARGLAFAATAVLECCLQVRFVDSFDVFHVVIPPKIYRVRSTTNSAIRSSAILTEIFSDDERFIRAAST